MALKIAAYTLFYSYVLLLVVAGIWGSTIGARIDQSLLFGLDLEPLEPMTRASLLSQYRFLRAIELGFGSFALLYTREIFSLRSFNRLFLITMLLGVLVRIGSLVSDGPPHRIFYFFLIVEALGVVAIYFHTRDRLD